jgi:hypothetical protein
VQVQEGPVVPVQERERVRGLLPGLRRVGPAVQQPEPPLALHGPAQPTASSHVPPAQARQLHFTRTVRPKTTRRERAGSDTSIRMIRTHPNPSSPLPSPPHLSSSHLLSCVSRSRRRSAPEPESHSPVLRKHHSYSASGPYRPPTLGRPAIHAPNLPHVRHIHKLPAFSEPRGIEKSEWTSLWRYAV